MKDLLVLLACASILGCAHTGLPDTEATRKMRSADLRPRSMDGDVRIECDVKDAEVYMDGVLQGAAGDFDGSRTLLKTGEGSHRIEIRKPGYAPYEAGVVSGSTVVVLSVHLQPM